MIASSPGAADLVVLAGSVVTMDRDRRVLADAGVAVSDGRIVAIDHRGPLATGYPAAAVLDVRHGVMTPGMVNAHQHFTGDPLTRSCIPDDLRPGESIFSWAVPIHSAHQPDDDEISAAITALEGLHNGVTTMVEAGTVAFPTRAAAGVAAVGGRATVGTWGWDIESGPFAAPVDEVLDRQRAVLEEFPRGGLVEGWVTLVGHNLASDDLLGGAAALARKHGTGMTMHLSPTSSDPDAYLERVGKRPVVHLRDLGVLGEHLLLAHGVWLDDEEIDAVLASRTAIAYCPWAYLRLGQGVARNGRHAEIARRGGRIALGCDASNAGDQIDILGAAALAAGLAKDAAIDPTWFGAHDAFEWATCAGAEAIGMGARIGSLEVGKRADLVVHDANGLGFVPDGDVALQLVWGTDGRTVRHVVVDGEVVIRDGQSVKVDEAELRAAAVEHSRALLARAGIEVPHRWPVHRASPVRSRHAEDRADAGSGAAESQSLDVRRRLAASLRIFAERDFDEGAAGHLSARDPEHADRFWMNPYGEPFEGLRARDLALVSLNGDLLSGNPVDLDGWRLHAAIYRSRPDVMSVMHAHPVHAKAWSALGRPLDPVSQEACIFYGLHAVFDEYNGTFGNPGESERVAATLGSDNIAVILRNHAAVTVGQSVGAAAYRFVILDRSCHVQLLAEAAGDPVRIDAHVAADLARQVSHSHDSFEPMYRSIISRYPDVLE